MAGVPGCLDKCGGVTQIDTMIVTSAGIYMCDAKNYAGDYVYEDGKWFAGGRELKLREVCDFMAGEVEKRYIKTIFGKYFELMNSGKYAKYKNPRNIFEYEFAGYVFK
ncbi:Nuclease-related domain-containing protein [Salinicoccus halodurans]|uniref:Nuclease-related domain-containing protein n=3 Tax=Salinicoccus halodurans TaxID=407035 RepID=A0AA94HBX5_9STAP|nr:Nuclease-related domain-containing protein [Salinicoccus halodurans]